MAGGHSEVVLNPEEHHEFAWLKNDDVEKVTAETWISSLYGQSIELS